MHAPIHLLNITGSPAKLSWAADIAREGKIIYRLTSQQVKGGQKLTINHLEGGTIYTEYAATPTSVEQAKEWANRILATIDQPGEPAELGTPNYRINYTIEKRENEESENFEEVGFGSSGDSYSIEDALGWIIADIQNRDWETIGDMPEPEEA